MPACEVTDSVPAYPPSFVVEEQSWEAPLRHGSAATSSASMMSQSDLSTMQYDESAPTIATRQLPRSGFVQRRLCQIFQSLREIKNAAPGPRQVLAGRIFSFAGGQVEAYPVDSGPSICSRRGAGDRPARLRGLSRLMMSQYPVGSWWVASPSSASKETWR